MVRRVLAALAALALVTRLAAASEHCPAEQAQPQRPIDPARCAALDAVVRRPSALPLHDYEKALAGYLRDFCHRRPEAGWKTDKTIRDTGPFVATRNGAVWTGKYLGTHDPVIIWYSPDMYAWLQANRPHDEAAAPKPPAPVPDGAMMVKE